MTDDQKSKGLGLAEFLAQLRAEIDRSQEHLKNLGIQPKLNLAEAEVEVSFGVTKEGKGKLGVEFYVFTLEAGGKYGTEQVHKMKLKLEPAAGSPFGVASAP